MRRAVQWHSQGYRCCGRVVDSDTLDPSSELERGLLLHYPFDGDAQDASGQGAHGTVHGAPTFVTTDADQGVQFDNTAGNTPATQYVSVPDITAQVTTGTATVVVCYASTDADQANGRLVGNWASSDTAVVINYNSAAQPHAYGGARSTDGAVVLRSEEPFIVTTDGEVFCHALTVHTSTEQVRDLIDDVRDVTVAFPGASLNFAGMVIGATGTNDTYGARSTIVHDFRIYDREVAPRELVYLRDSLTQ